MNTFWQAIIDFIRTILGCDSRPIEIGDHVFMPLFFRGLSGQINSTWNYLAMDDTEKRHLREYITANAKPGETPAICFCLTPSRISGGLIDDKMLAVTDGMLDYLEAKCKELLEDGIAIFFTLYVDDAAPRWWEIGMHQSVWKRVSERVGKYATGAILSIETNEHAAGVGQIDACIQIMRGLFPGRQHYGTHLQWLASNQKYQWRGGNTTPPSASVILVEYSWDPSRGDSVGVVGLEREYNAIMDAEDQARLAHHEYNLHAESGTAQKQREWLRNQNAWGVA